METHQKIGNVILYDGREYHCVVPDSEPWSHPEVGLRMSWLQARLPNLNFTPCRWRFICQEGVIAAVPIGYFEMRKPDEIPVEIRKKTEWHQKTRPPTEKERDFYRMIHPSKPGKVMLPKGVERVIEDEYKAVFNYLAAKLPNESADVIHGIMDLMAYEAIYKNGNRDYFVRVEVCAATIAETALLHRMEPAQLKPEKPAVAKAPTEQYIFRRNSRVWEIRYDSEDSAFVQPRKGFEYICFLLANPGQGFSLKEIKDQIDPPPPSEHSDDDIDKEEDKDGELKPIYNTRSNLHLEDQKLSPEQLASVKKRLKEMQSERNNSKTSVTRREELDENIKLAQDYLRKVADKAGRSRKFANANEKYRTAVANNIENAIKNLPAELKDFAQHINDCVTKGFTLKYNPASTINWLTEDM